MLTVKEIGMIRTSIFVCIVFIAMTFSAGADDLISLQRLLGTTGLTLSGTALNINSDKSTGVTFVIYEKEGTYHADGAYDSVNLFGRFATTAAFVTKDYDDCVCIQFSGTMILGDDGSGFPSDTRIPYTMNVLITRGGAKGIYHIGKIAPGIEWEQYGFLDLFWKAGSEGISGKIEIRQSPGKTNKTDGYDKMEEKNR
jgi:hypothetical protein